MKKRNLFQYPKKERRPRGCEACKHNQLGICELSNKEIGMAYILHRVQGLPKWCKKNK